ncbi:MAG: hypothetical protein Sw2PiBPW_19510 [Shewanella algae]
MTTVQTNSLDLGLQKQAITAIAVLVFYWSVIVDTYMPQPLQTVGATESAAATKGLLTIHMTTVKTVQTGLHINFYAAALGTEIDIVEVP